MTRASITLFTLAAVLAGFAYWGIYTLDGQHAFDEMAGIVPYSAGLGSVILGVSGLLTWWLNWRRTRRSGQP
ncbi:MAG TPA: hypothetical protein VF628_10260 [Allosphingosinicella sp.]